MAQIRDIHLQFYREPGREQQWYAQVDFSAEFSRQELQRSQAYGLYVGLFVSEDSPFFQHFAAGQPEYQTWWMPQAPPSGQMLQTGFSGNSHPMNQTMRGLTMWICREHFQPNQLQTHHIRRRAHFDQQRLHSQAPFTDFRAFVWMMPEIYQGQAQSPVMANPGNWNAQASAHNF